MPRYFLRVKTGHWKSFREGWKYRGKMTIFPNGISQKTYKAGLFHPARATAGCVCHGKTAVAPKLGVTVYDFLGGKIMKKILALLLSAVMLLSLCACGVPGQNTTASTAATTNTTAQTPETTQTLNKFTVTVVHKDGSSKDFTYETDEEFLGPVLVEDGLIQGNDGPYGLEITTVDGEQAIYNTDKAYWALYEGEEYALQGIDTTPIVDGAVYKLVYTGA